MVSRLVLLGMWSVAFLAVCASAGTAVKLTARDGGRRVALRTGDALELALAENPSTGYSWQIVSSGEPALRPDGEPTFKADGALHGSGGTSTRRFRAAAEGTSTLKLVYRRPWEKNVAPAATFEVTIAVTK